MSDETDMTGITPVAPEGGPAPTAGGGFLSSTVGKVLVIGGAIGILLVVAGVALVIVLGSSLFSGTGVVSTGTPTPGTAPAASSVPASGSAISTAAILPVPDIETRDVFTVRDPFEPIAAPKLVVETASGTGTSSNNDKTLVLSDITTENGTKKVIMTYSGTSYTLGEGGSIPNSPWKVLKIYTSSVVMLFGDDRVTLTVGQGITK